MKKINLFFYGIIFFSLLIPLSVYHHANALLGILPQPPKNLTAHAVSSSKINLSWTAPSDLLLTGYKIERSSNGGSSWSTLVGNTGSTATIYSDSGLAPSTTYMYRVSSIDSVGTSSPSNTASATTNTITTVPQPPTGLAASAVSTSQINLKWNAPSNNGGSAITGYKTERLTNGGSTWSILVSNTGSTSTTYSDTGLASSTTYTYRVSAINGIGTSSPSNTASATTSAQPLSINKVRSGLVAFDPLNNETKSQQQLQANPGYWTYFGDAPALNAKYDYYKDTQGLHIGSQAPANGTWAGFYAESPNTSAMLFHSIVTTPVRTIPYQYYENGMYIQTSQPFINYVTCTADTEGPYGTVWTVVSTTGSASQATQFNVLWADNSADQPLTRDCTIITNGQNYLKVYLDGVMVYSNHTLNLQMPGPFNTYLEPQSSYPGKLLNGTYKDYYATTDENIQVTNLPNNAARVDLTDTSGIVLASAPISSGSAILDVGKYHFPLAANIKVYDSNNSVITSTSSPANIFGGDIYAVK
jgi:hypothetical protein